MQSTISPPKTDVGQVTGTLMQMMSGFWVSQCLYTAAKLGVADELIHEPKPVSQLATALGAHEDNLYRLMRALASLGIFQELEERCFELTAYSELLRSDHPNSIRPMALMLGSENYVAWGYLDRAVKYGESPFETAFGMDVWEYFRENPEAYETFNQAMTTIVRGDNVSIIGAYDFSQFQSIVDVGGGQGMLLSAILKSAPNTSGILFDLPQVVKQAGPITESPEISARCEIHPGDFFKSAIPSHGDCYILSRVLHGFDDENAVAILQKVGAAMPEDSRLLLMEFIVEPECKPSTAKTKLMDVNMMVFASGGRDRTQDEYAQLLARAGFSFEKVTQTQCGIAIIEASKA